MMVRNKNICLFIRIEWNPNPMTDLPTILVSSSLQRSNEIRKIQFSMGLIIFTPVGIVRPNKKKFSMVPKNLTVGKKITVR